MMISMEGAGAESGGGKVEEMIDEVFSPPLDRGIEREVIVLRAGGVETFESCEGTCGHAYPEPTVRFHGHRDEGFRALSIAMRAGLRVASLRRVWPILDNEPTGPWWEMTFVPSTPAPDEREVMIQDASTAIRETHP